MHMPIQVVTTRNRKGRKRKSGSRYPSGDIVRERGLDIVAIAIRHPDRQGLPEEKRAHQAAESPLGRLCLRGIITSDQLVASRMYARDSRLYQQAIGCPKPDAPSLNPLTAGGRGVVTLAKAEIDRRTKAYNDAFCVVWNAGQKAARAVARTAFYGEWLPAGTTMDDLRRGLSALVKHYGLTVKGKSSYLGNRD